MNWNIYYYFYYYSNIVIFYARQIKKKIRLELEIFLLKLQTCQCGNNIIKHLESKTWTLQYYTSLQQIDRVIYFSDLEF